jgi:hypothetical protein
VGTAVRAAVGRELTQVHAAALGHERGRGHMKIADAAKGDGTDAASASMQAKSDDGSGPCVAMKRRAAAEIQADQS